MKTRTNYHIIQLDHSWISAQKSKTHRDTSVFNATIVTIDKAWNQLRCLSEMNNGET